MTMHQPPTLSPAAQAVLDAAYFAIWPWQISKAQQEDAREVAAAALRAAADRVPDPQMSAHWLHAIADELEGNHGGR